MGQGCTSGTKKEEVPTRQVVVAAEEEAAVAFSPDVACHGPPSVTTATRRNTISSSSSSNETTDALKEALISLHSSVPPKSNSLKRESSLDAMAQAIEKSQDEEFLHSPKLERIAESSNGASLSKKPVTMEAQLDGPLIRSSSGNPEHAVENQSIIADDAVQVEEGTETLSDDYERNKLAQNGEDSKQGERFGRSQQHEESEATSIIGATPTATMHARATQGFASVLISALKSQQEAKEKVPDDAQDNCAEEEKFSVSKLRKRDSVCGLLTRWSSPATVMVSVPTVVQRRKSVAEQLLDEERERQDKVVRRKR